MDLDDLRISRAAVVSVAEAASVFGVDVRTVTRAIDNGELPALRLGRRVLIPRLPLLAALGVTVDSDRSEEHDRHSADRGPFGSDEA
ncbi:excisionase family DNA-binding protein [Blastococcus aurantiacus]|uniref:excisionase family DNA-binding protein n=1 Tax=Blastococcus aurantiacus TaxID=1550231 RepID=UPI001C40B471|nr:excisionase family DNA-binding protein [Blastococcus aurantiacus]